jgi:hypothetical protein
MSLRLPIEQAEAQFKAAPSQIVGIIVSQGALQSLWDAGLYTGQFPWYEDVLYDDDEIEIFRSQRELDQRLAAYPQPSSESWPNQ